MKSGWSIKCENFYALLSSDSRISILFAELNPEILIFKTKPDEDFICFDEIPSELQKKFLKADFDENLIVIDSTEQKILRLTKIDVQTLFRWDFKNIYDEFTVLLICNLDNKQKLLTCLVSALSDIAFEGCLYQEIAEQSENYFCLQINNFSLSDLLFTHTLYSQIPELKQFYYNPKIAGYFPINWVVQDVSDLKLHNYAANMIPVFDLSEIHPVMSIDKNSFQHLFNPLKSNINISQLKSVNFCTKISVQLRLQQTINGDKSCDCRFCNRDDFCDFVHFLRKLSFVEIQEAEILVAQVKVEDSKDFYWISANTEFLEFCPGISYFKCYSDQVFLPSGYKIFPEITKQEFSQMCNFQPDFIYLFAPKKLFIESAQDCQNFLLDLVVLQISQLKISNIIELLEYQLEFKVKPNPKQDLLQKIQFSNFGNLTDAFMTKIAEHQLKANHKQPKKSNASKILENKKSEYEKLMELPQTASYPVAHNQNLHFKTPDAKIQMILNNPNQNEQTKIIENSDSFKNKLYNPYSKINDFYNGIAIEDKTLQASWEEIFNEMIEKSTAVDLDTEQKQDLYENTLFAGVNVIWFGYQNDNCSEFIADLIATISNEYNIKNEDFLNPLNNETGQKYQSISVNDTELQSLLNSNEVTKFEKAIIIFAVLKSQTINQTMKKSIQKCWLRISSWVPLKIRFLVADQLFGKILNDKIRKQHELEQIINILNGQSHSQDFHSPETKLLPEFLIQNLISLRNPFENTVENTEVNELILRIVDLLDEKYEKQILPKGSNFIHTIIDLYLTTDNFNIPMNTHKKFIKITRKLAEKQEIQTVSKLQLQLIQYTTADAKETQNLLLADLKNTFDQLKNIVKETNDEFTFEQNRCPISKIEAYDFSLILNLIEKTSDQNVVDLLFDFLKSSPEALIITSENPVQILNLAGYKNFSAWFFFFMELLLEDKRRVFNSKDIFTKAIINWLEGIKSGAESILSCKEFGNSDFTIINYPKSQLSENNSNFLDKDLVQFGQRNNKTAEDSTIDLKNIVKNTQNIFEKLMSRFRNSDDLADIIRNLKSLDASQIYIPRIRNRKKIFVNLFNWEDTNDSSFFYLQLAYVINMSANSHVTSASKLLNNIINSLTDKLKNGQLNTNKIQLPQLLIELIKTIGKIEKSDNLINMLDEIENLVFDTKFIKFFGANILSTTKTDLICAIINVYGNYHLPKLNEHKIQTMLVKFLPLYSEIDFENLWVLFKTIWNYSEKFSKKLQFSLIESIKLILNNNISAKSDVDYSDYINELNVCEDFLKSNYESQQYIPKFQIPQESKSELMKIWTNEFFKYKKWRKFSLKNICTHFEQLIDKDSLNFDCELFFIDIVNRLLKIGINSNNYSNILDGEITDIKSRIFE